MAAADQWREHHPGVFANLLKGFVSRMPMATAALAPLLRT